MAHLLPLRASFKCRESYLKGVLVLMSDVPKLQPHPGLEKKEEEEEEDGGGREAGGQSRVLNSCCSPRFPHFFRLRFSFWFNSLLLEQ